MRILKRPDNHETNQSIFFSFLFRCLWYFNCEHEIIDSWSRGEDHVLQAGYRMGRGLWWLSLIPGIYKAGFPKCSKDICNALISGLLYNNITKKTCLLDFFERQMMPSGSITKETLRERGWLLHVREIFKVSVILSIHPLSGRPLPLVSYNS